MRRYQITQKNGSWFVWDSKLDRFWDGKPYETSHDAYEAAMRLRGTKHGTTIRESRTA